MSGKARNSIGRAAGTSCCLQTVTGMEDLCALVPGLKPRGCASTASVAVLDDATHKTTRTCRPANLCARRHTKYTHTDFLLIFQSIQTHIQSKQKLRHTL